MHWVDGGSRLQVYFRDGAYFVAVDVELCRRSSTIVPCANPCYEPGFITIREAAPFGAGRI
jgi:hypothetical protein